MISMTASTGQYSRVYSTVEVKKGKGWSRLQLNLKITGPTNGSDL
jgi:hypothetical protein